MDVIKSAFREFAFEDLIIPELLEKNGMAIFFAILRLKSNAVLNVNPLRILMLIVSLWMEMMFLFYGEPKNFLCHVTNGGEA